MSIKKENIHDLWIKVTQKSDIKSFESFFYELNPRLIKFCHIYVHQREIAEEIVSDVFVKCWTQKNQLFHVVNIETYLFIAVKNQALNYVKRFSTIHMVSLDDNSLHLVDTHQPDKEMERRELIFKLDQAIELLPRQCRIVFRLIKDEGMKYKKVAEILGISQRTVQTQMYRAMKKLNAEMTPYINSTDHPVSINITLISLFAFTLFATSFW